MRSARTAKMRCRSSSWGSPGKNIMKDVPVWNNLIPYMDGYTCILCCSELYTVSGCFYKNNSWSSKDKSVTKCGLEWNFRRFLWFIPIRSLVHGYSWWLERQSRCRKTNVSESQTSPGKARNSIFNVRHGPCCSYKQTVTPSNNLQSKQD
jgi:hypothetical protein